MVVASGFRMCFVWWHIYSWLRMVASLFSWRHSLLLVLGGRRLRHRAVLFGIRRLNFYETRRRPWLDTSDVSKHYFGAANS